MLIHGKPYFVRSENGEIVKCLYISKDQCKDLESFRKLALKDSELDEGKGFFLSKKKDGSYFTLKVRTKDD